MHKMLGTLNAQKNQNDMCIEAQLFLLNIDLVLKKSWQFNEKYTWKL